MRSNTILCFVLIIGIISISCTKTRERTSLSDVESLVQQSKFIFEGTVAKLHDATIPMIQDKSNTAVVTIDEIYEAPEIFMDFEKKDITVLLGQPKGVKVGQKLVFFTNGWLYARSIAVREVGRIAPSEDSASLRKRVAEAVLKMADQDLQKRLAYAELVVVGKIVDSKPALEQMQKKRMPITEHAPDWWTAVIEIESTEKGEPSGKKVIVLFPNSTDEMWLDSPKFRKGQEGILLLKKNQQEKGWPSMRIPGYTALNPLDFQPKDQLERIRKLLVGIK